MIGAFDMQKMLGRTAELNKNGIYMVGNDDFRQVAAFHEDGTVYCVKAYYSADMVAETQRLRRKYGLPPEACRKSISLESLDSIYGRRRQETVHELTAGQKRMERVIREGVDLGASDIKLVEREKFGDVRMKVGSGEFSHGPEWQTQEIREAITWVYNHRDSGDGQSTLIQGQPAGFSIGHGGRLHLHDRLAAMRGQIAWHGDTQYFLTLRLIYREGTEDYGAIEKLGLESDVLECLAEERESDSGLVIIGGSTGDGKSTTLVRNLEKLYREREGNVSIYTMEDPIEYPALGKGIVQFAVRGGNSPEERRANFTKMLMTFVRTNPDIGMVSEVRSADDVGEILQFVVSGHKIFTTVHADSANAVLFRLISLGVNPKELSGPGVVNLVLRQKLVPVLCRGCARPLRGRALDIVKGWLREDPVNGEMYREMTSKEEGLLLRRCRDGCPECCPDSGMGGDAEKTSQAAWAGYTGRKATAEYIKVDRKYRKLLNEYDQAGAHDHWIMPREEGGMGGIPIATRLRTLVAAGVADYEWVRNTSLPYD